MKERKDERVEREKAQREKVKRGCDAIVVSAKDEKEEREDKVWCDAITSKCEILERDQKEKEEKWKSWNIEERGHIAIINSCKSSKCLEIGALIIKRGNVSCIDLQTQNQRQTLPW